MHLCSRSSAAWPLWSKQQRCRRRFMGGPQAEVHGGPQAELGSSRYWAAQAWGLVQQPKGSHHHPKHRAITAGINSQRAALPVHWRGHAWRDAEAHYRPTLRLCRSGPAASACILKCQSEQNCPGAKAVTLCRTARRAHPLPDGNHVCQSSLLNLLVLIQHAAGST